MTKNKNLRFFFSTVAILMTAVSAFAQGNGAAGITEATQMVTSYFEPATKLIYAIGAVVGLIGGVKVYSKFSSGDPDTGKTAASWFGACIFLIVAATILRSFFL
ncbi:transposase [Bacteroidia bacterium]|nr:transposase [Bacteroidia bacterium]